jgi:membrane protein DedA with SNARE-associated domain
METLLNQLSNLEHWKIALLASGILLQGAVASVFPEEVILTSLGMLWSQGKIGFFEAWLAVLVGLLPANSFPAFLGRQFGLKALSTRPLCWIFKRQAVENSLKLLKDQGNWVIFCTRFIPLIRGPIYFATGVAQIKAVHFFKWDALASCIQVPVLLGLGAFIGKNANSMIEAYQRIGWFMLIAIGILILTRSMIQRFSRRLERLAVQKKGNPSPNPLPTID